jgi:Tat protein secretion system quality control protein TatD with DNase activity
MITNYFKEIEGIITKDRTQQKKVVAIGTCGLDYDRFRNIEKQV